MEAEELTSSGHIVRLSIASSRHEIGGSLDNDKTLSILWRDAAFLLFGLIAE